ncbi:MAG TPA: type II secretion system F family protein [Phycisphaerae bacterium]|nr:type II secretion system F family protein [Phycisphaerae bacterium]
MTSYKYQVKDGAGQLSVGVVQAPSLLDATAMVRSQGGILVEIAPAAGGMAGALERIRGVSFELGPGLRDVLAFTNQLSVMIKAGINIRNAISGIADGVKNVKFRAIIHQIKADVESGSPFSEALSRHPKVFPPLYVNMVRASELSGNLGHMLERLADYLDQQADTRRMVIGAMVYPCIICVMAVVTTVVLLTFVLPKLMPLFKGKEQHLPSLTKGIMGLSNFMVHYWWTLVIAAAAGITGFTFFVRTEFGRRAWHATKLKIPLMGKMFRALYIARGLSTMGELVRAGVPMLETLGITADVSGNELHKELWQRVHDSVQQGGKIVEPLWQQSLLPSNVVQMVSAGEESGNLGEVLGDVSEFYSRELRATIKAVTSMIEPVMIIVMGVVVGFIVASILLPIFKLSNVMTKG